MVTGPIKEAFVRDFELGMGNLWSAGSTSISLLMQDAATFFARYGLAHSVNPYSLLVSSLITTGSLEKTVLSTLNYECLLDLAISSYSVPINYFDVSPPNEAATLWKLHGSCNFLPDGGISATRGVSFSPGVSFGTGLRACQPSEVWAFCSGNTALYPAMAIYMAGKPVQVAPDAIGRLQAAWGQVVQAADTVALIGVRPNPPDTHIWAPLADTQARILFVGNEAAFDQWRKGNRSNTDDIYLGRRFDLCIGALIRAL